MRGAGLINSSPEERTGSLFEDQVAELNDDILECRDFASRREDKYETPLLRPLCPGHLTLDDPLT